MLEKIDELISVLVDRSVWRIESIYEDFPLGKNILSEIDSLTRLIEARAQLGKVNSNKNDLEG